MSELLSSPLSSHETPTDELIVDAPSPVGERIPLPNGTTLERPNLDIIEQLQAENSRVHYFPTPNIESAASTTRGRAYYRGVVDHLGQQVVRDFPDTPLAVRGTTVALTERFPYWDTDDGVLDMNSVRDILASGTDSGSDEVRAGHLDPSGELNVETQEWLNNHIANALIELEGAQRDQVFPALLVYRMDAFTGRFRHGYNTLTGDPSQRLAALYITDKIK